jgi:predicted sulfurtransferase
MPIVRVIIAALITKPLIHPASVRAFSSFPRKVPNSPLNQLLNSKQQKMSSVQESAEKPVKVKGPKGGNKPPIFDIPEKERLFTAEGGLLLKDVVCFSLYHFAPVSDPDNAAKHFQAQLKSESLKRFAGTCYLAKEGMNSQYSVATDFMPEFRDQLKVAVDAVFGTDIGELDINVSETIKEGSQAPFKRFRVVSRPQILTDGLDEELVWSNPGPEIEPEVWHDEIANSEKTPLILDCRNDYESDVGAFEGAIPLDTKIFQETWPVLDKMLEGKPKDEPVYMYCTGGIRCVKVGAYVTQKQGFKNVRRLKHGTIGYERWVKRPRKEEEEGDSSAGDKIGRHPISIFKGANFIFDEREQSFKNAAAGEQKEARELEN